MSDKIRIVDVPIYLGKLVIIDSSSKAFIKKSLVGTHQDVINEIGDKDLIYAHTFHDFYKKERAYIIIVNTCNTVEKITYGVLAHEALHTMNNIFIDIDYKPKRKNDETSAYLIQWIVNQISDLIFNENDLECQ